jgi:CheY-like chemotaxis protein
MDHMMPGMDGVDTMKAIRGKYPEYEEVPIIALTANAVDGAREMLLGAGMQDYIAKPIDVRQLMNTIRKWLPKDKVQESPKEDNNP